MGDPPGQRVVTKLTSAMMVCKLNSATTDSSGSPPTTVGSTVGLCGTSSRSIHPWMGLPPGVLGGRQLVGGQTHNHTGRKATTQNWQWEAVASQMHGDASKLFDWPFKWLSLLGRSTCRRLRSCLNEYARGPADRTSNECFNT